MRIEYEHLPAHLLGCMALLEAAYCIGDLIAVGIDWGFNSRHISRYFKASYQCGNTLPPDRRVKGGP